tara:strand:- start:449 stop:694 length:246 start_codon:yes stop_codon:yes gene_type:complete
MVDNIKRYNEEAPRKCDGCNKGMWEGWCGGDGADYRCSDKCLFKDGYTKKLFREDLKMESIYWTDWYDEPYSQWHCRKNEK